MKIRNKNTGAEYSSKDLKKEGLYYIDRSVLMDNGDGKPIAFMALEDGWEEVGDEMEHTTKWHDLRKDPTDVPNELKWVWVYNNIPNNKFYAKECYSVENGWWVSTTGKKVVAPDAWIEFPEFKED